MWTPSSSRSPPSRLRTDSVSSTSSQPSGSMLNTRWVSLRSRRVATWAGSILHGLSGVLTGISLSWGQMHRRLHKVVKMSQKQLCNTGAKKTWAVWIIYLAFVSGWEETITHCAVLRHFFHQRPFFIKYTEQLEPEHKEKVLGLFYERIVKRHLVWTRLLHLCSTRWQLFKLFVSVSSADTKNKKTL